MTKATTRPVAVLAVLAVLSFLVTACGSGASSPGIASVGSTSTTTTTPATARNAGQSGATSAQLLKYAECIRSHGVPNLPDPVPAKGGGFAFRVSPGLDPQSPSPQLLSAEKACQKDVPPSIATLTPAESEANALKYSDCMRSHGEPDFPLPDPQGLITITNRSGIMNPNSPQFQKAEKACQRLNNGLFAERDSRWTRATAGPAPTANRSAQGGL